MTVKIINKHVLEALKEISDESIDCIITSPPYYGLRVYKGTETDWNGWNGQLGLEPTYDMYIQHLMMVTKELKRVLKKTGTIFWNMGDSYCGDKKGKTDSKYYYMLDSQKDIQKVKQKNIPAKSLMMIPERFAMAMIDDGWVLRNKIVWYKRNGRPSSVKDRFSDKWEYVFFFVKNKNYYFDLNAVRKPFEQSSIKRISQKNIPNQFKSGKSVEFGKENPGMSIPQILNNMHQKYEENSSYEGIHSGYFNEDGSIRVNLKGANPGDVLQISTVRHKSWESNAGHGFTHERKYDPNADGGDFMSIATIPHKESHFAIFPETLVAFLMKAGCPKGGVVLDPFAGSGTTGVVAEILGRDSVLVEISQEYCKIIDDRLKPENIEKVRKILKKSTMKVVSKDE